MSTLLKALNSIFFYILHHSISNNSSDTFSQIKRLTSYSTKKNFHKSMRISEINFPLASSSSIAMEKSLVCVSFIQTKRKCLFPFCLPLFISSHDPQNRLFKIIAKAFFILICLPPTLRVTYKESNKILCVCIRKKATFSPLFSNSHVCESSSNSQKKSFFFGGSTESSYAHFRAENIFFLAGGAVYQKLLLYEEIVCHITFS